VRWGTEESRVRRQYTRDRHSDGSSLRMTSAKQHRRTRQRGSHVTLGALSKSVSTLHVGVVLQFLETFEYIQTFSRSPQHFTRKDKDMSKIRRHEKCNPFLGFVENCLYLLVSRLHPNDGGARYARNKRYLSMAVWRPFVWSVDKVVH
jgi:hypothetical protein